MSLTARLKQTANKGFTLIELLVVIGILGLLAAALVATIDPLEQLNKASDANMKNVSVEFQGALVRYYTTHSTMPWETTANGGNDACNTAVGSEDPTTIALSSLGACTSLLATEGELKVGFSNFKDLNKLFATEPNPQSGQENESVVCFMPVSRTQQKDLAVKYGQDGSDGVGCKSGGGANNCYWCSQ